MQFLHNALYYKSKKPSTAPCYSNVRLIPTCPYARGVLWFWRVLQYSHMDELEYSGFKTNGTDIDDAYSDIVEIEEDADLVDFDSFEDPDE